jgi:hypothetical protein
VKINKPRTSSRKEDIQNWLRNQNISFEDSFSKKKNLQLVKHYLTDDSIISETDEILKAEGHTVLRLPPYNCQYNPIELWWADFKNYYNKHIPSVWRELQRKSVKICFFLICCFNKAVNAFVLNTLISYYTIRNLGTILSW